MFIKNNVVGGAFGAGARGRIEHRVTGTTIEVTALDPTHVGFSALVASDAISPHDPSTPSPVFRGVCAYSRNRCRGALGFLRLSR